MYVFQIAWLNLGHVLSVQKTTNFLLGKCLIRLNDISFFYLQCVRLYPKRFENK